MPNGFLFQDDRLLKSRSSFVASPLRGEEGTQVSCNPATEAV